jgi:hypothetical protein
MTPTLAGCVCKFGAQGTSRPSMAHLSDHTHSGGSLTMSLGRRICTAHRRASVAWRRYELQAEAEDHASFVATGTASGPSSHGNENQSSSGRVRRPRSTG